MGEAADAMGDASARGLVGDGGEAMTWEAEAAGEVAGKEPGPTVEANDSLSGEAIDQSATP